MSEYVLAYLVFCILFYNFVFGSRFLLVSVPDVVRLPFLAWSYILYDRRGSLLTSDGHQGLYLTPIVWSVDASNKMMMMQLDVDYVNLRDVWPRI